MSESLQHHYYVKFVYNYVKGLISPEDVCFIKADLFECEKPRLLFESFIPDVLFCHSGQLIIGEAKTFEDYKTDHSYRQFESYMKECSKFSGQTSIVICLPWQLFFSAKNHFGILKRKYSNKTKVIIISDGQMETCI